MNESDEEH